MFKKFLILVATAVGVAAVQKQLKAKQAEDKLWNEATDTAP